MIKDIMISMEAVNKSLADEISKMAETDQAMRMKAIDGEAEWDSSVDKSNQDRLMEIIDISGWPTISKVGTEASHAAWLLAQHAPSLEFMERCLNIMEALPIGEVSPANIAYLKDRILMMNGKPQIYGTQFQGSGKDMHVWLIEDEKHVDERRASVGLSTFAENEARLRELYKAA
jgi:hypothetical protein